MASTTPKLLLRKPDGVDLVNVITDLDDNYDKIDKLPAGELDYKQAVVVQGGITAAADVTSLISTALTFIANRKTKITVFIAAVRSSVAADIIDLTLMEGATQIESARFQQPSALNYTTMMLVARFIPTAAVHTYKVQLTRNAGTGTVDLIASATAPAFLLIEDIGGV